MNTYQAAKQLRYLIQQIEWNDAGTKVFAANSVMVSQGPTDQALANLAGWPLAVISPGNASIDPTASEEPDLVQHDFVLTICNVHNGDPTGESVLVGGNASDLDSGSGRGLLEIEEQVLSALSSLSAKDGIRVRAYHFGATRGGPVEGGGGAYAAMRTYTLRVLTTMSRSYEAATGFTASDAGGGDADISWTLPPTRFDYRRMVLRRASGSTAPSTATSGTGVTLGGSPDGVSAVSVTDSPGAGTFSYSLWVSYDDFGASLDSTYTASGTATVVVT